MSGYCDDCGNTLCICDVPSEDAATCPKREPLAAALARVEAAERERDEARATAERWERAFAIEHGLRRRYIEDVDDLRAKLAAAEDDADALRAAARAACDAVDAERFAIPRYVGDAFRALRKVVGG